MTIKIPQSKIPQSRPAFATLAVAEIVAEIKAATAAFDRGESNMFEALDSIIVAVEAYRAAQPRREAA
jgi:hypothetical protein